MMPFMQVRMFQFRSYHFRAVAALTLMLFAPAAGAQDMSVLDQVRSAGVSIYAIGALSILALAVTIERFVRFVPSRVAPQHVLASFKAHLREGNIDAARQFVEKDASTLAAILAFLAKNRSLAQAALSERAADMASLALRKHQQKAYPLAVVATVAPIIGLLGTVIGMIEAFHVIAYAGGLGDPALLAGGISKALVNTAAGLAVALPALALHHFFKHRLTSVSLLLETQLNEALDEIFAAHGESHAH